MWWIWLIYLALLAGIILFIVLLVRRRKPATSAAPLPSSQQVPLYAMVTMPDGSQQMMPVANSMVVPMGSDAPNGGFATLGFFFPVVGLILFLVWKDQTPLKARSAGKGALIGVIVDFVVVVAYIILMAVLVNALNSPY